MRPLLVAVLVSCGPRNEPECNDVFYADADGDAFGDPEQSIEACAPRDGYVANADDCDDTRYSTRPGAEERCNGADDDCDGSVDEDAADPVPLFLDPDGDGYGDAAQSTLGCAPLAGYAPAPGDCDETDPAIHPGADEVCDGIDNDCDHLPDEDDPGLQGDLGPGTSTPTTTASAIRRLPSKRAISPSGACSTTPTAMTKRVPPIRGRKRSATTSTTNATD